MNYIGVNGGTLKQRDLVKKAIDFAITEMMPRFKTLDISVDILQKLEGGVFGYCWPTGEKNAFQLELKRKCSDVDEFLETIMHEMVHVKQFAKKELVENRQGTFWKARNWTRAVNKASKSKDYGTYNSLPWEIEAYDLQNSLLEKFKENNV